MHNIQSIPKLKNEQAKEGMREIIKSENKNEYENE